MPSLKIYNKKAARLNYFWRPVIALGVGGNTSLGLFAAV
jgi:hypothetical protein